MSAIEQVLIYQQQSTLAENDGQPSLQLCANASGGTQPVFFDGRLNHPLQTARCLRSIAILVGSRFYTPPAMLARILRESDPVVTVSRQMLRFEGFSACCSTYGRLDVCAGGFDATKMTPGTTNVDFQAEMRGTLATIRSDSKMALSVGATGLALTHNETKVIEKKVKLPLRWIKGFCEVQAIQTDMTLVFQISRNEAIRFFRQLPKSSSRHPAYIVAAGKSIRLSQRKVAKCVRITGCERLAVLVDLVQHAQSLTVYTNPQNTTSAWVLAFADLRFTLVVSEEKWRGFSGEGQLLKDIASGEGEQLVNRIQGALNWQEAICIETIATELQQSPSKVAIALSLLATRGLVGFDIYSGHYFHRVLPFDLSMVDALNPRIKSAKTLVAQKAVSVKSIGSESVCGEVNSGGVVHRVELAAQRDDSCTCPWFAKHQSSRGPCKHILALLMSVDEDGEQ
jgi:hypothetical protein